MKIMVVAAALIAASVTGASAQNVLNLSGRFICVQDCRGGVMAPAFITQNGWNLDLVNEVGEPSRAWIDWPGHVWVQYWNEGAVYSPDGMMIQFDNGTVWQRAVEPWPVLPPSR